MYSNGNSFSNGQSVTAGPARPCEPWYIRLLSGIQDRGST